MRMKWSAILGGILTLMGMSVSGYGQTNRYMVFFEDKDTSAFLESDPHTYLSQRSIDRRQNQSIPLLVRDFPVTEAYLDTVRASGMEVYHTSRWLNACLATGDIDQVEELQKSPAVKMVEYVAPRTVPENARLSSSNRKSKNSRLSGEHVNEYQNVLLGIDKMQEQDFMGQGMLIAVVDGGFKGVDAGSAFAHLHADNRIVSGYNFVNYSENIYDYSDHGTKALSTMAALKENTYTGAAPEAHYMLLISEDVSSEYRVEEYNWIFAAEMADSAGADIVTTSLGYNKFDDPTMDYTLDDLDGHTAVISMGSNLALETGMLIVSSAGNEGDNKNWEYVVPPADAPSVLAVGSYFSETTSKASFSSIGPTADERIKPDVMAPGAPAWVIDHLNREVQSYGTSFAAPIVAGLAAGLWQANPDLTAKELMDKLISSGSTFLEPDTLVGHGSPNFERAQNGILLSAEDEIPSYEGLSPYPYPNPLSDSRLNLPVAEFSAPNVSGSLTKNDGSRIIDFDLKMQAGETEKQVELGFLPPGIYILTLSDESLTRRYRLVKY